jgi:hypothetical protein
VLTCALGALYSGCVPVSPDDSTSCPPGIAAGPATVSFADDVLPLLAAKGCLTAGCHGSFLPSSDYVLTSYETAYFPGEAARALDLCPIVPNDPEGSWLIEKLGPNPRTGDRMPNDREPLSDAELELIATWIREGAADN